MIPFQKTAVLILVFIETSRKKIKNNKIKIQKIQTKTQISVLHKRAICLMECKSKLQNKYWMIQIKVLDSDFNQVQKFRKRKLNKKNKSQLKSKTNLIIMYFLHKILWKNHQTTVLFHGWTTMKIRKEVD